MVVDNSKSVSQSVSPTGSWQFDDLEMITHLVFSIVGRGPQQMSVYHTAKRLLGRARVFHHKPRQENNNGHVM